MVAKATRYRKEANLSSLALAALFIAIVGVIGTALVAQNARMIQKRAELTRTLESLEARVSVLGEREEDLQAAVDQNEDEFFQEKVLRERGLYQRPGEQVVTILSADEEEFE
ncbi:MAG: hypothetical protein Q8P39_02850, partial [Candidatus Yanofskybacteria bacterium]|nr:hypothetical protein [Candidatus Yanofskybacteria bacterium]